MIEINLLPGDGKKKRRAKTTSSAKFECQPSLWFAGITEKITDKYDYFDVKATLPENPADLDKVFGTQEEIGCKMA